MTLYIPPEGIAFKLQNYKSKYVIYSNIDGRFDHYFPEKDFADHYWNLIPGTGNRSGYYRIKSRHSDHVIFSRFHHEKKFWHYKGPESDDQFWKIIPGTGDLSNYFKLENYVTKHGIISKSNSTFNHYLGNDDDDNQYWTFVFETMTIETIEYKINERILTNSKPIVIASKTLVNNSDEEQQMILKVEGSQKHSLTFEYSSGFLLKIGEMELTGIPIIGESIEAAISHTWTFGKTHEFEKRYTEEFLVKCGPRKKVRAEASIIKSNLRVPFIIRLKSKETGFEVESYGVYSSITTQNLKYTTDYIEYDD